MMAVAIPLNLQTIGQTGVQCPDTASSSGGGDERDGEGAG